MSESFRKRADSIIHQLVKEFGTAFYLFDEVGMLEGITRLKNAYRKIPGFEEFFALKATPNMAIARLLSIAGLGFDLSSPWEAMMLQRTGISFKKTYFSSNNTARYTFIVAQQHGVQWINLDDASLVPKVPEPFPLKISLRFNPGPERLGNHIIGDPASTKYGHMRNQLMDSYKMCLKRGAKELGIHAMICSNERKVEYHVETVRMLLDIVKTLERETGVRADHINQGGGIYIPYRPGEPDFEIEMLADQTKELLDEFRCEMGWAPKPFMECGRCITGPHAILVASVINHKDIYKNFVGIDANTGPDLLRSSIYASAYHHITVVGADERPKKIVSVTGAQCEGSDVFGHDRELPETKDGDIVYIHDVGAHGKAMGNNYNGWPKHAEFILRADGSVEQISRDDTFEDYIRPQEDFEPKVWIPQT
jgi:diaminopimelate decarboxylase